MSAIINFFLSFTLSQTLQWDIFSEAITIIMLLLAFAFGSMSNFVLAEIFMLLAIVGIVVSFILVILTLIKRLLDYVSNRRDKDNSTTHSARN